MPQPRVTFIHALSIFSLIPGYYTQILGNAKKQRPCHPDSDTPTSIFVKKKYEQPFQKKSHSPRTLFLIPTWKSLEPLSQTPLSHIICICLVQNHFTFVQVLCKILHYCLLIELCRSVLILNEYVLQTLNQTHMAYDKLQPYEVLTLYSLSQNIYQLSSQF